MISAQPVSHHLLIPHFRQNSWNASVFLGTLEKCMERQHSSDQTQLCVQNNRKVSGHSNKLLNCSDWQFKLSISSEPSQQSSNKVI